MKMKHKSRRRSFWKRDLSWFFKCSSISGGLHSVPMFSSVSLEQDWNTWARLSSVSSCSWKSSDSRFLIEQITSTNRELLEQSNCPFNRRLFCKYPSPASRSKILRRLSSGGLSIDNDLYKFIIQSVKSCDKFSFEDIYKHRLGSCMAILMVSNFASSMFVVLNTAAAGAAVEPSQGLLYIQGRMTSGPQL